jgi:protein involved in temperature-dependent protein secretion
MAVYVDNLRDYGWRHGPSCHLIADSVEELIEFAIAMGMREEWFQAKSTPHFDLTASGRELALQNGAVELTQRELVQKLRELRRKRLETEATANVKKAACL